MPPIGFDYRVPRRWFILAAILAPVVAWILWSELNPGEERELRVAVQRHLEDWFPEPMTPPPNGSGFVRDGAAVANPRAEVVLVHGLDEPGGIWADLQVRLDAEGIRNVEFRYPNDQAVDASADELAHHWSKLATSRPVFVIGHSMGGLVVRDFVSRHRHPVVAEPSVGGPEVGGVILIATPNHGSEWARLRVWLELREYAADLPAGRFSLFSALRDGTGAAKIDLRPGSEFLQRLNSRPWPDAVPIRIIGGLITGPTPVMEKRLAALSGELELPELEATIGKFWTATGESVGDGAVPVNSLPLEEAPPPLILPASHRGLIAQMPFSDEEPPAIQAVIDYLNEWRNQQPERESRTTTP